MWRSKDPYIRQILPQVGSSHLCLHTRVLEMSFQCSVCCLWRRAVTLSCLHSCLHSRLTRTPKAGIQTLTPRSTIGRQSRHVDKTSVRQSVAIHYDTCSIPKDRQCFLHMHHLAVFNSSWEVQSHKVVHVEPLLLHVHQQALGTLNTTFNNISKLYGSNHRNGPPHTVLCNCGCNNRKSARLTTM